eukprot:15134470-Alexandrium_andersonii.AAC.1
MGYDAWNLCWGRLGNTQKAVALCWCGLCSWVACGWSWLGLWVARLTMLCSVARPGHACHWLGTQSLGDFKVYDVLVVFCTECFENAPMVSSMECNMMPPLACDSLNGR